MPDTGHTLRGIDYKSTFAFTHLFKGFRLAIDPSKLGLALAMILLVNAGGRLLDAMWPHKNSAVQAVRGGELVNEIDLYESNHWNFAVTRRNAMEAMNDGLKREMTVVGKPNDPPSARAIKGEYAHRRDESVKAAEAKFDALSTEEKKNKLNADARDATVKSAYAEYELNAARVDSYMPRGPFISFLHYEIQQVDNVAQSAVNLDLRGTAINLGHLALTGPKWAVRYHAVFFAIFFAYLLLLWSVFGGAIARVAAVQVARDEKISVRQALRFSSGKVLSFVFAPLIPIIIVLFIAVVLGAVGVFMGIPYVGGVWTIIVGIFFFLALLAGLVMALTTIGLIGGGHLMYPTIAVEGSDSFDAVSRSFSYLYARPWQLIFYSLVALVYGAITYLFVRFFLYVLLYLTHVGVGLFLGWRHAADGMPLFNAIWPHPTDYMNLAYDPNFAALSPLDKAGASILAFWVYVAISLVGAYVVSLYFSSSTIIYYLMRREVDATGMDDVYVEPSDDEFADPVPDAVAPEAAALVTDAPPASDPAPGAPAIKPTDTNESGQPVDLPAPPSDENRPL